MQERYGPWLLSNFVPAQYLGNKLIKFSICNDVDQTKFGLLRVTFNKFTTQLWTLVIVRILFPLSILPVKEITL